MYENRIKLNLHLCFSLDLDKMCLKILDQMLYVFIQYSTEHAPIVETL